MQAELSRLAQDLQLRKAHVEAVVQLLDEGNTIPFITRYRKERTGAMPEELIRRVQRRLAQVRQFAERKQVILRSIESQGKLTEELRQAILAADSPKRLEDLYLPFKPKKRSLASEAREKGLEPLALAIWNRDPVAVNLEEIVQGMVNPDKGLNTTEDVIVGVRQILAEIISEQAEVRGRLRKLLWESAKISSSKQENLPPGKGQEFKGYFEFTESVRDIPPHRILAINRGERENVLKIKLDYNADELRHAAIDALPLNDHPHRDFLLSVVDESLTRFVIPGLEREIRRELTDFAMDHAVTVFARNLRSLLLQPPLRGKRILAIDPGFRHGCKLAVLDEYGNLLHHDVIYPHTISRREEPFRKAEARIKLEEIIRRYQTPVIAIGNGTACRETERLIADLIADLEARQFAGEPKIDWPPPSQASGETTHAQSVVVEGTPVERGTDQSDRATATVSSHEPTVSPTTHSQSETETALTSSESGVAETPSEGLSASLSNVPSDHISSSQVGSSEAVPAENVVPTTVETAPETIDTVAVSAANGVTNGEAAVAGEATSTEAAPLLGGALEGALSVDSAASPMTTVSSNPSEINASEVVVPREAEKTAIESPAAPKREPRPLPELPKIDFGSLPPAPSDLAYCVINEAGASEYSTSEVAREEFPDLDPLVRGTISIGRRLQDPLAELVKIDPAHIGVGLYQHDIRPKNLRETLDSVIESCVNHVGVDLNTASVPLLRFVAGFNALVAREVVEYRKQHGPFKSREQLQAVPGVGPARFTQAAGFLKIPGSEEPLDETWIHPESYPIARKILEDVGLTPADLRDPDKLNQLRELLKKVHPEVYAEKFKAGLPTVKDIFEALAKPSRDPREELPPPVFRKSVLQLEELQPGMQLRGTVLNVVDFGVFVDIGLKESGLVHISQIANRYIKNPYEVVSVNDVVTVWVRTVDLETRRVSLTMIPPGSERRPPAERRGASGKAEGEDRPMRGPRRHGSPRSRPGNAPRPEVTTETPTSGPRRFGPSGSRHRGRGPHDRREASAPLPTPSTPGPGENATTPPAVAPSEQISSEPKPKSSAPPRRPAPKPRPLPKLSKEAITGKTPLLSFGELAAYFKAKESAKSEERNHEEIPEATTQTDMTSPPIASTTVETSGSEPVVTPGNQPEPPTEPTQQ
jgi:uncharacterized protein